MNTRKHEIKKRGLIKSIRRLILTKMTPNSLHTFTSYRTSAVVVVQTAPNADVELMADVDVLCVCVAGRRTFNAKVIIYTCNSLK